MSTPREVGNGPCRDRAERDDPCNPARLDNAMKHVPLSIPKPPAPDREPTEVELRQDLAAAYRLIALFGMTDLVFTHLSARIPGEGHRFLINPYGLLFEEITASSLVEVDAQGEPRQATSWPVNPAGFVIHSAIHTARPDAVCVMHTHTLAGMTVAAQTGGLLPLNQISMEFHNQVGLHEYEGIAADDNLTERERIVRDLGMKHCLIMRNHGLLTVGRTVAEAFYGCIIWSRPVESKSRRNRPARSSQCPRTMWSPGPPISSPPRQIRAGCRGRLSGESSTASGRLIATEAWPWIRSRQWREPTRSSTFS
jgi:ribulose-5-phosphate 4-epimerase/fuculose-1-phosphate aldolase